MSNNSSMITADRTTHLKIVVVSLFAAIVVVAIGIAAHPLLNDNGTARLQANAPMMKAGQPVVWTSNDDTVVR